MKSVRLLFSKNIFAVIFLKWGEQTVIEMKKKTLRKVTLEVPPCNSFVKISPATFLVNARDKSSLVLSNLLWRMVLWLITVNFENTSILFHHFLYERLFFFQYTCIYLFHVMLHNYKYIIYIYFGKNAKVVVCFQYISICLNYE